MQRPVPDEQARIATSLLAMLDSIVGKLSGSMLDNQMSAIRTVAANLACLISAPLRHRWAEVAAVVLLCPILLSVAIWNGFPIIYYDTGAYLLEGLGHAFVIERSPVYSIFLFVAGGGWSLWTIAAIQALMTAFVMTELARVFAPRLRLWALLLIGVALVIATGLPWYVGQIEPDCLTALVILSIYLLAFHTGKLGAARSWLLVAIGAFCTAAHPSHLVLTAGLALSLGIYRGALWIARDNSWPKAHMRPAMLCFVLALAMIVGSNFVLTGQVFVTRAGPAFLFARMLQDRIVMKLLEDTCPGSGYRLCDYKNALPRTADGWLWGRDSPFFRLDRFAGTNAESQRIIWDSIKRYPLLQIESVLSDTAVQFVTYRTGDQIEPQQWALQSGFQRFIPAQVPAYLAARQQLGQFRFQPVNLIDVPVAGIVLVGLGVMLFQAIAQRRRKSAVLLGYVLVALLGNAFICGALSNPHARYQSRIIWIVPFALVLAAVDWRIASLRGVVNPALNGP